MNIGTRLKQARSARNLTQGQLESVSGVKQGTISKIERGDQDSTKFIVALSKGLGVSAEWLETGAGDEETLARIETKLDWLSNEDLETIRTKLSEEQQKTIKTLLVSWVPDNLG